MFLINTIIRNLLKQANFIETKPGIRELSLGYVKQGQFIIIAVPVIFDLIAVKDDGFGNEIEFDESILGTNGMDVVINGQNYLVFGEFILVDGERKIGIKPRKPIEPVCKCPEVTDQDITNIIDGIE